MGTQKISYALPVSCIRVDATVTATRDAVPEIPSVTVPDATVALHVGATGRDHELAFTAGKLFSTGCRSISPTTAAGLRLGRVHGAARAGSSSASSAPQPPSPAP